MKEVQFPGLGLNLTFPNGIDIGPIHIAFYGALIATGLILALVYAFRNFRKVGVDPDKAIDCILFGIVGAVLGARLYFVAFSWDNYGLDFSSFEKFWNSLVKIFAVWEGGLAIYGGIIGGILVGVLVARHHKICVNALLDLVGVGFLLGQGIGRWGNFFNVEAFGSNTTLPWGMTGPDIVAYLTREQEGLAAIGVTVDPNMPVHPCFLYESIWCLVGFFLLAAYVKRRKFDGEVFLMYLAYYGAERAIVEGLRTDSLMFGTIRVSQLLAVILVVVAILMIVLIRNKIKSNHDENYRKLFVLTEAGQAIANAQSESDFFGFKKKAEKASAAEAAEETAEEESDMPEEDAPVDEESLVNDTDDSDEEEKE